LEGGYETKDLFLIKIRVMVKKNRAEGDIMILGIKYYGRAIGW
jgi:hypothetical protein